MFGKLIAPLCSVALNLRRRHTIPQLLLSQIEIFATSSVYQLKDIPHPIASTHEITQHIYK